VAFAEGASVLYAKRRGAALDDARLRKVCIDGMSEDRRRRQRTGNAG